MSINVEQQASNFLERDWLMMLMMSSANGGFERQKVRLVLDDEFPGFYCNSLASQPWFLNSSFPYRIGEPIRDQWVRDDPRVVVEVVEGRGEQAVFALVEPDYKDEVERTGPRFAWADAHQTLWNGHNMTLLHPKTLRSEVQPRSMHQKGEKGLYGNCKSIKNRIGMIPEEVRKCKYIFTN